MSYVFLQIIKWILLILLCIFLLLLFLFFLVLTVPIVYRMDAHISEKVPKGRGRITWFYGILKLELSYRESFLVKGKLFGRPIYDSRHKKGSENGPREADSHLPKNSPGGNLEEEKKSVSDNSQNHGDAKGPEGRKVQNTGAQDNSQNNGGTEGPEGRKVQNTGTQDNSQNDGGAKGPEGPNNPTTGTDYTGKTGAENEDGSSESQPKLPNIREKIENAYDGYKNKKELLAHYHALWNKKETQVTFQRAKKKLFKVLKALLPKKWRVRGELGFEDPGVTGEVMGILSILYPVLVHHVQIVPDFEEEVMELSIEVKGKLRGGYVLYQLLSLLLNKYSFRFIKLIINELNGKNRKVKQEA